MAHVCPWWGGYFIDNRLRRWIHNPETILRPYIKPGMTVLDFGCGMGLFSIEMARLVGADGRVFAVDLQPQMLRALEKRATAADVSERIRTHCCSAESLDLDVKVDFALAFYSAHEVPDVRRLMAEMRNLVKTDGGFLVVEPKGHVTKRHFAAMLDSAMDAGFEDADRPRVRLSHAVWLRTRQDPADE